MIIEKLAAAGIALPVSSQEYSHQARASFSDWLLQTVNTTNKDLVAADKALQQLASGEGTSLHHSMLIMEQAKLSLQFLEQIRNRLMSAWQDLSREQI